jgi:hypothetical protein
MHPEVVEDNDCSALRAQLRTALAAALTIRAPRWLVDLVAASVGELAGLSFHENDPEEPAVMERGRSALRVWDSYRRSQAIVESF